MWRVNMYNKKYYIGVLCLVFLMFSFVSAVKPITDISLDFDTGLVIFSPTQSQIEVYEDHIFNWQVFNKSNGLILTNESVNCSFGLLDMKGNSILTHQNPTYTNNAFRFKVTSGNFTEGYHNIAIKCVATDGSIGGQKARSIYFTEGGLNIDEGRATIIIGLLGILVLLLFISLFALFNIDGYMGKFILYWVSHVLAILITFSAWQIGIDGLLSSMALTGIFHIMFLVLTIAVLPMMILSVAWIVYIHTYNEHFQKLIDKGEDTETAFAMTSKKKKGWFSGN